MSVKEKLLRYLVETDLPLKEIAWQIDSSYDTVRTYTSELFRKFRVNTRIALVHKFNSINSEFNEELTLP